MRGALRLISILLSVALLLGATGCGSYLYKDYLVVHTYEGESGEEAWSADTAIQDYRGLLRALNQLVSDHNDNAKLTFNSYDGDINEDIAMACGEVRTGTALGAYAVDYISYNVSRIVSYYEAEVFITYKRTVEETEAIVNVANVSTLTDALRELLLVYGEALAASINSSIIDTGVIRSIITRLYYENPTTLLLNPDVEVAIYPEGGIQKIIDLSLDYKFDEDTLEVMRNRLKLNAIGAASKVEGEEPVRLALGLCRVLAEVCVYDRDASARAESEYADSEMGATAYGALVEGFADSEGFAMAYKALCEQKRLECEIVSGRYQKETHFWCVIKLDGDYYHVDPSVFSLGDEANSFLRADSVMWSEYSWDAAALPECEGELTYEDAVASETAESE